MGEKPAQIRDLHAFSSQTENPFSVTAKKERI